MSSGDTKKCTRCLKVLPIEEFYLFMDRSRSLGKIRASRCRPCVTAARRELWQSKKGIPIDGKVPATLHHLYLKASYRKKNFSLSKGDMLDLWAKQEGKCALTGWEMTTRKNSGIVDTNVSIDRIDPTRGYETGNVQLVCASVNKAKWALQEPDFLALCKAVLEKKGMLYVKRNRSSPRKKRGEVKLPQKGTASKKHP